MPKGLPSSSLCLIASLLSCMAHAHSSETEVDRTSVQGCAAVNRIAGSDETRSLEAIDIHALIAPQALACSTEITTRRKTATIAQRRAQLKALDTLSFYANATSQNLPLPVVTLAESVVADMNEAAIDPEATNLLEELHAENRSSEWLGRMQLTDEVQASEEPVSPSGVVTTLVLINGRLRSRRLDLATVDMVVVAGCHVAQRAAEKLKEDPKVQRLLAGRRVVWMQPAGRTLELDELEQWNAKFPATPMHVALRNSQWVGMDLTALPTFHVMKDGKVVASHRGWSRDGATPGDLLRMLKRHRRR